MNEEEMRKDILFDIEMQLYAEFNDTIATMNDHLGEIYGYSDVENVKQLEQQRKIELMEKAIKQLQNNWNELKKWLKEQKDYLTKIDGQNIPLKDSFEFCSMNELYQTGKYSGFKESLDKMQELEQVKDENN